MIALAQERPGVAGVSDRLQALGILNFVCDFAHQRGIPLMKLLSRDRHHSYIAPRHELWTVVRDTLDLSLNETGRLFDRDHTTILVAIRARRAKAAATAERASEETRHGDPRAPDLDDGPGAGEARRDAPPSPARQAIGAYLASEWDAA